mgnify:CR=1 FL=1
MAVRDMDVAAEVIGIPMLQTKLLAFAVSSFYCGVAGALWALRLSRHRRAAGLRPRRCSFQILFMVIIGGAGERPRARSSAPGSSCCLPIFLNVVAHSLLSWPAA